MFFFVCFFLLFFLLSSGSAVSVRSLFLTVPCIDMWIVIVAFPRHTHLLFLVACKLNARVLDSRSMGCGFEPHRKHCIVSLSSTLYPLLSTGLTQEDTSRYD